MKTELRTELQHWLDDWGDTLVSGDAAKFVEMSCTPMVMIANNHQWTLHTDEDIAKVFEIYRASLAPYSVDMVIRTIREIEPLSGGEIKATYQDNCMQGAQRALTPTMAQVNLRREDNAWKVFRLIQLAVLTDQKTNLPVLSAPALYTERFDRQTLDTSPSGEKE